MRIAAALLSLLLAAAAQEPGDRLAAAQQLQRREGYQAALAFLEADLSDPVLATQYMYTAIWAGEEERALERLRSVGAAPDLELPLLWHLGRFRAGAERARETDSEEWVVWFEEQAARRERIADRTRLAAWVAAIGAAAIAGLALLLFRLAPGRAARAGARAG